MADNQKQELNEEQILSFLQDIVGKIRTEEDPFELNKYRRLFRKAVPFTLRAYFAAYLLKQMDIGRPITKFGTSGKNDRFQKNDRQNRSSARDSRTDVKSSRNSQKNAEMPGNSRVQETGRPARLQDKKRSEGKAEGRETPRNEVRVSLPEDLATTLFVSIGRNRRVYPRDIITLIMQNSGIEREHIGEIRVLDNYSFVQVLTVDAETVIETLNEVEYRGRKISVSHSRKRDEQPTVASQDEDLSSDAGDTGFDDHVDSLDETDSEENLSSWSDEGDTDFTENKEE